MTASARAWLAPFALALCLAGASARVAHANEAQAEAEATTPEGGDAHEAGEGHHGFSGKTFAFQLFNFAVLVVILAKFGGGALNKSLRQRHDQLKKDLEEASALRAAAEARLKTQEKRLTGLEEEIRTLQATLKSEAESERARLIAASEEKAHRIQSETKFLLDQQVKEAELRFRAEVASAAAQVAADIIKTAVTPADQARLAQTFTADVAAGPTQVRS